MANTKKRNKKTKRTATKRRSLRGIRGNRGSNTFLTDLKEAAMGVGATGAGVMAAHGLIHNLLKDKDGHFVLSPKDKTSGVPDDKMGGGLTGLGLAIVSSVALTQVENSIARDAIKGAGAACLEIGVTSYMSNLKNSLGLKGVDAAENEYDDSPEESIDWESIAAEAMREVQGVDDDNDDDDDNDFDYDDENNGFDDE